MILIKRPSNLPSIPSPSLEMWNWRLGFPTAQAAVVELVLEDRTLTSPVPVRFEFHELMCFMNELQWESNNKNHEAHGRTCGGRGPLKNLQQLKFWNVEQLGISRGETKLVLHQPYESLDHLGLSIALWTLQIFPTRVRNQETTEFKWDETYWDIIPRRWC